MVSGLGSFLPLFHPNEAMGLGVGGWGVEERCSRLMWWQQRAMLPPLPSPALQKQVEMLPQKQTLASRSRFSTLTTWRVDVTPRTSHCARP